MIQNALFALIALHSDPVFNELVACQAIANEALKSKDLPTRIKLFNWGANDTASEGKFIVGKKTLDSLAANKAAHGFDRIALDYNHNSLKGHPNFQPDPRKVAAYGVPVVIEGEGLFLDSLSWTPSGQENALEYSDLSPTVARDASGEVTFIHSAALCPQGQVKGLTFLSADVLPAHGEKHTIHKTVTTKTMDFKKLLCAILGLDPEKATDEAITAAAEKFGKEEKTEPEHKEEAKAEAKPDAEALSAAVKKMTDGLTALQARMDKQERDQLVALAVRDGKEIPKSAATLSNDQLTALVAELPVTVPLSKRTPDGLTPLAAGGDHISPEQAAVNRNLGISDETFKKHNS